MRGEGRVALVIVCFFFLAFVAEMVLADTPDPGLHSTWPESAEFSELLTGQTRFSTHESGLEGILVLVDHRTGVQYLVTATGACPLLDADGTPLRVREASDDGE